MQKAEWKRMLQLDAISVGSASKIGVGLLAAALAHALAGCAPTSAPAAGEGVFTARPPSKSERYCAWYGSEREGVLYFGQAPFWPALRAAGGDPLADLARAGPQLVGRFDLARAALREPLDVTAPGARGGVWDVFAHPNGRVYFTTFFEPMGWVDAASGAVTHLPELGNNLNEIAPGPGDELLVSRYGSPGGGDGSVLRLSPAGEPLAEHPVRAPPGLRSAPKTVAYDPLAREIWVTTDLIAGDGSPPRHDAYVLDLAGRELRRIESPEVQFAVYAADGHGARAEAEGGSLWLVRRRPGEAERRVLLDEAFAQHADFAQEVVLAPSDTAVVTRWGGAVHVVDAADRVHTLQLPALEQDGLYYTGVLAEGRVCATYCGGVRVVCRPAP
jgi:hypothetical protein